MSRKVCGSKVPPGGRKTGPERSSVTQELAERCASLSPLIAKLWRPFWRKEHLFHPPRGNMSYCCGRDVHLKGTGWLRSARLENEARKSAHSGSLEGLLWIGLPCVFIVIVDFY